MGAWGAGNFENDDAMDFLAELSPVGCAPRLAEVFEGVISAGGQGEEIDATDACRVLAGAELIAAARGHAGEDLPDDARALLETLKTPASELSTVAVSAVSYVLLSSELLELWAESDDPGEWNEAVTDLINRLDAPTRAKQISQKEQDKTTSAVCSFCGTLIATKELVSIDMRRPWTPQGISHGIFAHATCLNAKLHPKHLVQWWTPDLDGEPS